MPSPSRAEVETKAMRMGRKLRKVMIAHARKLKGEKIITYLSSGVDSQTVLFSQLEAGLTPAISAFTLDDRESRDFKIAREIADTYNLKFVPVFVPTDLETIQRCIWENARLHGCDGKIHIETFYPIRFALDRARKKGYTMVTTGHGADTYYCLSRRANIEYKGREDDWRNDVASSPNWNQRKILMDYVAKIGIKFFPVYQTPEVFKIFKGSTVQEINKPRQKEVSRQAFADYFQTTRVYNHQNYHHGDTGIAELFPALLDTDLNVRDFKSVKGIYNAILRGEFDHMFKKAKK